MTELPPPEPGSRQRELQARGWVVVPNKTLYALLHEARVPMVTTNDEAEFWVYERCLIGACLYWVHSGHLSLARLVQRLFSTDETYVRSVVLQELAADPLRAQAFEAVFSLGGAACVLAFLQDDLALAGRLRERAKSL